MKTKSILYGAMLLTSVLFCSCNSEEDFMPYSTDGATTELGKKIINDSGFIGHYFSDKSYSLANGVNVLELDGLSSTGLATKILLFEVNLNEANINIKVSTANNYTSTSYSGQPISGQAMLHDTPEAKVLGAVNGDFFDTKTYTPRGILYKNGNCIKSSNSLNDNVCTFFAITKDKKAVIGSYTDYSENKNNIKENIFEAIGGRVRLIKDGEILSQSNETLEPRTCIGVTEDNIVYIMEVDGRNFWHSNGMSYNQMASVMKSLEVKEAINLDGGGSSTFVVRNDENTENPFEVRNWPYDNGGVERAVTNGLLIVETNN